LTLNPALNGTAITRLRFSGNFRNQWVNGGTPYLTGTLGVESKILTSEIPEYHNWGIGLNVLSDQSNGGGLVYTTTSLGTAYHLSLNPEGTSTLGIGFQGSWNQRAINLNRLNFESQFSSGGFSNSLPIGETFDNLSKSYFDIHSGILYQFLNEDFQFSLGASCFNIVEPKTNSSSSEYRLPRRYVLHSAFNANLGADFGMICSFTSMTISGLNTSTLGLALRKHIEKLSMIGGCWYRLSDSIIPYVGIESNGLSLGLSFDNTISSLKTTSLTRNAFELGIIYTPMSEYNRFKKAIPWY
jgi:type IX secretion system PorP/SprF family membrane protein